MNRRLLALGASAILLAVPATADAYDLGTDPDIALPDAGALACTGGGSCTIAIDRLSNAPLRIPDLLTTAHGVITRWRVHGEGGEVRLRRFSPDARTALGATAWAGLPSSPDTIEHPAQLAVASGDAIGLDLTADANVSAEPGFLPGADTLLSFSPALGEGATGAAGEIDGYVYLQVTVEPDRDQDGRGDDTYPPVDPPPPPPPPPYEPPPHQPPPPVDPPRTTPRVDPVRSDPADDTGRADPYAGLPKAGPAVTIAGRASASRKGVVSFSLANPYGFAVKGTVKVKRGRRAVGSAKVSLAANGSRVVKVRLDRAGKRTVARGRKLKLTLAATLRAPVGRARTTTKPVTVSSGSKPAPTRPRGRGTPTPTQPRGGDGGQPGGDPIPQDEGFDGTYRAPDGLTMVVQSGRVLSFSGSITTYCTRTSKQRDVAFGMFGDDPDPTVAADGSFAYEATTGYGFIKLKYDGRIVGDTASGRLVVEDRSPLLGTGRFEFDYCFAGKDWSATK